MGDEIVSAPGPSSMRLETLQGEMECDVVAVAVFGKFEAFILD